MLHDRGKRVQCEHLQVGGHDPQEPQQLARVSINCLLVPGPPPARLGPPVCPPPQHLPKFVAIMMVICSTEVIGISSGALSTIMVEPTMHSPQPSFPRNASLSFRISDASTALHDRVRGVDAKDPKEPKGAQFCRSVMCALIHTW